MRRWVVATLLAVAGCSSRALPPLPKVDAGPLEFIDESFDQLYPVFLLRKIAPAAKAALWTRYHHRWVRWTGTLISFTPTGCTIKHIDATVTFDVSLNVEPAARARLHQHKIGDQITYVGQLDNYDDVFRTMYLIRGDLSP